MTRSAASPVAPPAAATVRTFEYGVVPNRDPLLVDLHRPPVEDPVPVVVFVHGGGWRLGDRAGFGPMYRNWRPTPFEKIVAAGLAVASVDYRLSNEAAFPAQLDDISMALQWLFDQASALGLDPDRIALWGESAGGHLAALTALSRPGVRAVVDWYGPSDLTTIADDTSADEFASGDPDDPESRESLLLGGPLASVPYLAAAASPVRHVHAAAPAFLLLHGTADSAVPKAQSRRLAAALTACGASVDLQLIEGADHLWRGDPATARDAFDRSLDFVLAHLSPPVRSEQS